MRKPREQKENGVHHVTVQTNRGEKSFLDLNAQAMYRDILKKAQKKFNFTLISCVFTENWVDLYIYVGVGCTISAIMHWVQPLFTRRWNKKYGLFGSFWRDRFFSEVIEYIEEVKEWMEQVFKRIKEKLFKGKMKIWSIKEFIAKSRPGSQIEAVPTLSAYMTG
ncbi:MAG: transposase [Treponema sp.]|jgi:REP element-mobilizing transposase RayT|nr:transposase [Treponema sp.]